MNLLKQRIGREVTASAVLAPGQSTSFVNPFSYMQLRTRPDLLAGIGQWAVDGKSLQALLARAWRRDIRRVSFDYTSLAGPVFRSLHERGGSIYVLGSDTASVERFAAHLASEFPGIVILGYRNGYFDDEAARLAEARRIAQMKPDFVLVGMGAVRQEEFVLSLFAQGFEGAAATCGGFIHQTARSGRSYYPAWIDRFNLRFVYRMYDEPSLVRRYLLDYPRAFALILGDLCRKSPEGESAGAAMEKSR